MNLWTSEDISKILIQLDEMQLPFSKYTLCREDGKLKHLGRGGSSEVYEAQIRSSKKKTFAMKVIGFKNQSTDSDCFEESVQVQKDIGDMLDCVVKIFDHTEIWVTLDDNDYVVDVKKEKPETTSRMTIRLQFILMEKIAPVISRTKDGTIKMLPEELSRGDEKEVLKLAYDIGTALKRAHNKNVLHRDVKLENVFYSEKKKQYKLGDFGIAKKTEDGFAGTIAFTKGYAAPEVRASEDRYDNTADIYSFGMMLYVLTNNLRFPDSNTYNVNSRIQYSPGYIVPEPTSNISADLYYVILKACMYNPDERYQSMEEMLLDIEKLIYGISLGFMIEHKNSSLIVGSIMLALGVVAWKLTFAADMVIKFSLLEHIFIFVCLGKGILKAVRKSIVFTSYAVLGLGMYLMISTGFSLMKLFFLLWMTFSSGRWSGYISTGVLIAYFISAVQRGNILVGHYYSEYSWIAITIISISVVLLCQYYLLSIEDRKKAKLDLIFKKGLYWIFVLLVYIDLFMLGLNPSEKRIISMLHGDWIADFLFSIDLKKVGFYGLVFCIFWIGREKILIYMHKKQRMES